MCEIPEKVFDKVWDTVPLDVKIYRKVMQGMKLNTVFTFFVCTVIFGVGTFILSHHALTRMLCVMGTTFCFLMAVCFMLLNNLEKFDEKYIWNQYNITRKNGKRN